MALRKATADDWIALGFGADEPAEWFGLTSATTWLIEGIGCAYKARDGRWWLSFHRCVPGKLLLAQKAAKQLLTMADERGITLHALADPKFAGSETWIERLGFSRSDETIEGLTVWTR